MHFHGNHQKLWRRTPSFAILSSIIIATPALSTPASPLFYFDFSGQTLRSALIQYARQTSQELFYTTDMVAQRRAPDLQGRFTAEDALSRLLQGSDLRARRINPRLIILDAVKPAAAVHAKAPPVQQDVPVPMTSSGDASSIAPADHEDAAAPRNGANNEIIVIGSNIRGGGHGASPVTSFTRADMERNGYATVAQALTALPANFRGTATEQSALAFVDGSGTNATLATGVNLRGLGANATLVLVNGHRVAGAGLMGDFSDVSSIPTGAVDHVDVLLDGASALYGSDAVGGVVNITLRQRFSGAETRARFGSVTRGGQRQWQVDETIGRDWGTGGIYLSYEYDLRTPLASADRAYARSADSRAFGGIDHRNYLSIPGNLLSSDAATGSFGPAYAIPDGQDGTTLTAADFLPGVVNLENFREGIDLTPRQERHSAYALLTQDLNNTLHLSIDGRYSHRAFEAASLASSTIAAVTDANPWFVSPDSTTSDLIAYSFARELGPSRLHGYAETVSTSATLDIDLPHAWRIEAFGAYGQERDYSRTDNIVNNAYLSEALGATPDNPATVFSTATDGYFNPYGDGTSNPAAMLAFVGSGYTLSRTLSRVYSGNVQADGPLFRLPGGPVRLAIGANLRREHFSSSGADFFQTATPDPVQPVVGSRLITAGYAELQIPMFGPDNARPGLRKLLLSVAGRYEHYSDFGHSTNPKIGIIWTPVTGMIMRATYGTSFRAPSLPELAERQTVSTTSLQRADGSLVPVIQLAGGNPDLDPESARTWTAGFDIQPTVVPGLKVSATVFRTLFRHRIDTPALSNFSEALIDRDLAPFVQFVSPASDLADLAYVTGLLTSASASAGNNYPASSIGAIVDTRYVNTGAEEVSGIDFTVAYSLPVGRNRIDLGANGSYLLRYRQQYTPDADATSLLDLAGEPIRFRGHLTAGWSRGPLSSQLSMNYQNRYRDDLGNRISAWTTFDLGMSWQPNAKQGWRHGFSATLTMLNMFDRDPPFYDSRVGAGYDAANADATGRTIAIQFGKSW